jgi:6-phosphogluconate dehydrogenase
MQVGMVGLGRMGANMVRRLLAGGHECVVFDVKSERVKELTSKGATGVSSLDELAGNLSKPRAVWVMVPAGEATEQTVRVLAQRMETDDTIIDGGNSYYKDDPPRSKALAKKGIHYLDVGTSGGIWGAERGYCLMIGGEEATVKRLDPIFKALAPGRGHAPPTSGRDKMSGTAEEGYLHCGPPGAGHFAKMIHNGIEYGLMQAYAEGFDILRTAGSGDVPEDYRFSFNIADIAEVWRRGSVIESWLLDLISMALTENPTLSNYTGLVEDSGEGRWAVMAAIERAVPVDVISASLYARFRSRQEHTFAEKVLSAMRYKMGGHLEPPAGE